MDEESNKRDNRIVVLLNNTELEVLIFMVDKSGLATSSFVRQLILRQFREECNKGTK